MKAVRFGFWFLITMIMVQLLTLLSYFNPDLYWISPIFALTGLLTNLSLNNLATIVEYIIYPMLFHIPWLIVYIFILTTNTNRHLGKQRFLTLSILGIIEFFMYLGMGLMIYGYLTGNYNPQLYNLIINITGVLAYVFLLLKVFLPNYGYLKHYKILTVVNFVLGYGIYWIIYNLIDTSNRATVLVIEEFTEVFLALISTASYYYLMKYLQIENDLEFEAQSYSD